MVVIILYIQGVYISHYKFCCARGSVHVCITQVMGVLRIIIVHVVYLLYINFLGHITRGKYTDCALGRRCMHCLHIDTSTMTNI